MTPGARVQAAIELLDDVLDGSAAEQALTNWARRSRFAGSKDRRAVRDHVYQALRCRRSYAALGGTLTGRALMIGHLRSIGAPVEDIFTGQGYGPAAIGEDETASGIDDPNAAWDMPDWLIEHFKSDLGDKALPTALALTARAPTMLRVNRRKSDVDQAITLLAKDDITVQPDPIAETALMVTSGAPKVQNSVAFQQGVVELQDGSSQAAMARVDLPHGGRVLDFCAGGGGKTLALAARAEAKWFAHDALPQRMKDIPARSARAGAQVTLLETEAVAPHAPFDLVLCDVPCSGSGTWRRTPQAKWTLSPSELAELTHIQADILTQATRYVGPEGSLIYATCSVLNVENTGRIQQFLDQNPEWICVWQTSWDVSESGDGFFCAQLKRAGV